MRTTLLDMVQSILSDLDSEQVNSINDSVEAMQIASVIEDTYYNLIAARLIPELKQFLNLTSLSDNTRPTHFRYPTNVKEIEMISYNVSTTGSVEYREIPYVDPMLFLSRSPSALNNNSLVVTDVDSTAKIIIANDRPPSYYTSFDDEHIVMDAYKSSIENTLQESKTRAYGTVYPSFSISDTFEPDLDKTLLPYLLAEAKSACFSLFKAGSDPKIEQAARRLKSYVQNDQYRTKQENKRPKYGR
jgi:hypothetical protein